MKRIMRIFCRLGLHIVVDAERIDGPWVVGRCACGKKMSVWTMARKR